MKIKEYLINLWDKLRFDESGQLSSGAWAGLGASWNPYVKQLTPSGGKPAPIKSPSGGKPAPVIPKKKATGVQSQQQQQQQQYYTPQPFQYPSYELVSDGFCPFLI